MPSVFQPDFHLPRAADAPSPVSRADTQDYFTEVATDYRAWSPSYNTVSYTHLTLPTILLV